MYLSAFSVVEVGFSILVIQQAFGFLKLFPSFNDAVAAFHFVQVNAVFANTDEVNLPDDTSFGAFITIEKYVFFD